MMAALAGTPALAAVCAALCPPEMVHTSAGMHEEHGATASSATTEAAGIASEHRHQPSFERDAAVDAIATSLSASDPDCCARDEAGLIAAAATARVDVGVVLIGAPAVSVLSQAHRSFHRDAGASVPGVASVLTRGPLVLRI